MTFEEFIEKHHNEYLSDYVRYEDMISWVDEYNDYIAKQNYVLDRVIKTYTLDDVIENIKKMNSEQIIEMFKNCNS